MMSKNITSMFVEQRDHISWTISSKNHIDYTYLFYHDNIDN